MREKIICWKIGLRIEANFLLHRIYRRFASGIIKIKWLIPSYDSRVIADPSTGSLVHTSFSQATINGKSLVTFRFLNRDELSSEIPVTAWTVSENSTKKSGIILNAEDARAFSFNGSVFVYFQRPILGAGELPDCSIHIFEPSSGREWEVRAKGITFNGKNWIPFERDEKLYFIYSIAPLTLIKCDWGESDFIHGEVIYTEDPKPSKELRWGDDLAYFGAARGGSQLIRLSQDAYLGFTHITLPGALKFSHQAGVILFSPNTNRISHAAISKLSPGLLVDPFGISIIGDKVEMHYSYAVNNPSDRDAIVGSSSICFVLSDLLKMLTVNNL